MAKIKSNLFITYTPHQAGEATYDQYHAAAWPSIVEAGGLSCLFRRPVIAAQKLGHPRHKAVPELEQHLELDRLPRPVAGLGRSVDVGQHIIAEHVELRIGAVEAQL